MNSEYDFTELISLIENHKRIGVIKELTNVSGLGLKEAKEKIDVVSNFGLNGFEHFIGVESVLDIFREYVGTKPEPYTKEEFLNMIENCIDSMDTYYFSDMLEATLTTLVNIKNRGGLEMLEKERDKFLRNI
jgi:hypothetical protein